MASLKHFHHLLGHLLHHCRHHRLLLQEEERVQTLRWFL
jgi:hypothetical protein